jgi:c-di-GMP-related signal transduction protein
MEYFLTRHAIFDMNLKVYGYELAFRQKLEAINKRLKEDQKTSKVLTDAFHLMGIETVTRNKRAFVKFTKTLLISEFAKMFPKNSLVVIIGNDVIADNKVVTALKELKKGGYQILLDDFSFIQNAIIMLPYATYVRVDAHKVGDYIKNAIIQKLKPKGFKCIVKNVIDQTAFQKSLSLGFDHFQGNFFSKPAIVKKKDIPVYKANFMMMLREISKPDFDFAKLGNIIKRDVSLTFKLLRVINSASVGMRSEVKSIQQALVMLGINEVKRWVTLVILSKMGEEKPDELMNNALQRARFLELLAPSAGLAPKASDLFMVGLLSLMDALMDQPLQKILEDLPLPDLIKDTLTGKKTVYQNLFNAVLTYEKGDWPKLKEQTKALKIEERVFPQQYKHAIHWVSQIAL